MSPDRLWKERVAQLGQDLKRIEALLAGQLLSREMAGRFRLSVNEVTAELDNLTSPENGNTDPVTLYSDLASLTQASGKRIEALLELLGGVAIGQGLTDGAEGFDGGFANLAGDWLNKIRADLDLQPPLLVITGRGPQLEAETAFVRTAFLDCDLWHLPLLGRALGLQATQTRNSNYQELLGDVVDPIVGEIEQMLERDAEHPPVDLQLMLPEASTIWRAFRYVTGEERTSFKENNRAQVKSAAQTQRKYLNNLFADMFATAILGPCYALAVFALGFDYSAPQLLELEDPDLIEGRTTAPRFLPGPVHRAAAILATLKAMDKEAEPESLQGPYTRVTQRLEDMWRVALESAGQQDLLDEVGNRFGNWHSALYSKVINKALNTNLKSTRQTWENAQSWHKALVGDTARPSQIEPALPDILGAIWLHRLDYPDEAEAVLEVAQRLMHGKELRPRQGTLTTPAKAIAQVRLDGLQKRWDRLERILKDNQLSEEDRAAIAGRFYRMISEQTYALDLCRNGLDEPGQKFWRDFSILEDGARSVQREALEFLGGLLVHKKGLDCEPPTLTGTNSEGPSVCDLADRMLRTYSRRTGVNWAARTVLGKSPFLATNTDVIRIRFLEWSLWNLPLMAHEFGHLAALATPAFQNFQGPASEQSLERHPNPEAAAELGYVQARRRQLDELFADIFAVYTAGPAFACSVIMTQLSAPEAYVWRGSHPSHDERVRVILQTLSAMNERNGWRLDEREGFGPILTQLEQHWDHAVQTCKAVPEDEESYRFQLKQAKKWGRNIYKLVDTSYRLGVSYKPVRWDGAQKLSTYLLQPGVPKLDHMEELFATHANDSMLIDDVLNALWIARLDPQGEFDSVEALTTKAFMIGARFIGR